MRAFLSHSSRDKAFVEDVADTLTPGTFELDAETFDAGILNAQAIVDALGRSDLFVIFLSQASIKSAYVEFETLIAFELIAKGQVARFLAICLDESSFREASSNVRFFNVVRRASSPESAARLIQGSLVAVAVDAGVYSHPFIGREVELKALEGQVVDPSRPNARALYVSGNYGSGRRAIARKFYQNQYPHVGIVFPQISLDDFSGLEELFRKVLAALRPSIRSSELRTRIAAFAVAGTEEKQRQIADLLNSLLAAREAAFLVDMGGILTDTGEFEPEVDAVIGLLESKPHPPVCVISPRMVPFKFRRQENDVAYLPVQSLERDESRRLMGRLLKDRDVTASPDQLDQLLDLAEGHPFNFYRILEEVISRGLAPFLADPGEFVEWKHRHSSEYLARITLTADDLLILGLLSLLPSLDFSTLVEALGLAPEAVSATLLRLGDLHVVEHTGESFRVSPALRIAVERDSRVGLSPDRRRAALSVVANSLQVRIDEGSAAISLIDAAVLSAIEAGTAGSAFASAFLLPSHYVWLAKRNYDERHFTESIRLAKEALKSPGRLSPSGLVAACRFMCLAAARLGESETFETGIARLQASARDSWAKSNVAFLRGFNARFQGNLPLAEEYFRESYRLSPGNISTAREIASIALIRGDLDEAEKFAREARSYASSNPYVIDILISVLIRKLGRRAVSNSEVQEMLDALQAVGEEGGRSFYTTRRAELEHLWGDNRLARTLIEEAIERTPAIFETRRLYAEILLKDGNNSKAAEVISWMRDRVNARDASERRANYRPYLETNAKYLVAIRQFSAAKDIYRDTGVFTEAERDKAIRDIEIEQGYTHRP